MTRTTRECARMFHVLGDPTRLRLVQLLAHGGTHVAALARAMQTHPARVSHHLAILKAARIVRAAREGQRVRYQLSTTFRRCVQSHRAAVRLDFPCVRILQVGAPRAARAGTRSRDI